MLCIVCAGRRGRSCCNVWWVFFFCCVRVDVRFVLGRVWAWADFVMCDRRGGFMCALFACIACIFLSSGYKCKGRHTKGA